MTDINAMRILGPYNLVEPLEKGVTTKMGLILPATMWKHWRIAKVTKLGEKRVCYVKKDDAKQKVYIRPDLRPGDIILIENLSMQRVELNLKPYFLCHYYDAALVLDSMDRILPM